MNNVSETGKCPQYCDDDDQWYVNVGCDVCRKEFHEKEIITLP